MYLGICLYFSLLIVTINTASVLEVNRDTNLTFGGRLAEIEDFPYQVSIHLSYSEEFKCGGSIISSSEVVTVAHCMFYEWGGVLPPIIVSVRAGASSLSDGESSGTTFAVKELKLHPKFNKETMEYDLAVLKINGLFPSSTRIQPVPTEKVIYNTTDCFVGGWNEESRDLRVLQVDISACDEIHSNYVGNICVLTKYETDTLCKMSPGSSLVCDDNLIGVLSIEANCANSKQPTIFESIRNSDDLLVEFGSSSAPTDLDVSRSFTIWSLLLAVISFVFSLLF